MSATKDIASAAMPYVLLAAIAGGIYLFRNQIAGWFSSAIGQPITDAIGGAGQAITDAGQGVNDTWGITSPDTPISGDPNCSVAQVWLGLCPKEKTQTEYEFGGNITPWAASGETGGFADLIASLPDTSGTPAGVIPEGYQSPATASGLLDSLRATAQEWRSKVRFAGDLPDLYTGETAQERAAGIDILYRDSTYEIGRTNHSWWMTNLTGGPGTEAGSIGQPVPYAMITRMGLVI